MKIFVAAVLACVLAACACGCDLVREYEQELGTAPDAAVVPDGNMPAATGDTALDLFDVSLYILATLGLGPFARLLGLGRPLIAPLVRMMMRRNKPVEPPKAETPAP